LQTVLPAKGIPFCLSMLLFSGYTIHLWFCIHRHTDNGDRLQVWELGYQASGLVPGFNSTPCWKLQPRR